MYAGLHAKYPLLFISNFRRVLNIVCFLLCNSPASEFRPRGITQKIAYNTRYYCQIFTKLEFSPQSFSKYTLISKYQIS